jgi:hypothetical protein
MPINPVIACSVVITMLAPAQGVSAQSRAAAPNASPPATPGAALPVVAEQADRLLKEMGAYTGSAEQFPFHADIAFDHVLPSGRKLQFSAAEGAVSEATRRSLCRVERRSR